MKNLRRKLPISLLTLLIFLLSASSVWATTAIPVFGGPINLSSSQLSDYNITVSGNLTTAATLILPDGFKGEWNITNSASGTIALAYKSQATPITISQGATQLVYGNGISLYIAATPAPNVSNATGTLPVANGGFPAGPVGTSSSSALTDLSNNTALLLPHWRKALANVRDGVSNARVLYVGDSTSSGIGSSLASSFPYLGSTSHRMAQLLNSSITPAVDGLGVPPSVLSGNPDNRWNPGTGWTQALSFGAGNGAAYEASSTAGNLVYTPSVNCDGFYLYYLQGGGLGTLKATATGGSQATINTNGASSTLRSALISAGSASSSNTLTITNITANSYVVGVEPVLSSASQVLVGNAGVGSSTTTGWTLSPSSFGGIPLIKAVSPDLTIISLGINDAGASTSASTVQTNLQALITAGQVSGDVIIETWPPSSGSPYTTYEPLYLPVISSLAATNNIPVMDIYGRLGQTYNASFMHDNLHPNDEGYWDWAQGTLEMIVPIAK
jgi:lysophospholipase L1-like esterase